jgi:hypothetical protein
VPILWVKLLPNFFDSQEALQEYAYVSKVSNVIFHGRSRLTPAVSLSGGDIIDLTLAWNKDAERIVVAKKGARITLKEYVP